MNEAEIQAYLEHHGVKGMHWGVRHKRINEGRDGSTPQASTSSRSASKEQVIAAARPELRREQAKLASRVKNLDVKDVQVLKAARTSPAESETLEGKYGPDKPKVKGGLSPAQKRMIAYGAVGVGAGIAAIVIYKGHGAALAKASAIAEAASNDKLMQEAEKAAHNEILNDYVNRQGLSRPLAEFMTDGSAFKSRQLSGVKDLAGLKADDLHFPAGHRFSRVSTDLETAAKNTGFYAATNQEDLERYKATIPTFWKTWPATRGKTSGHVMHYSSDSSVKVASEKKLFDAIHESLDEKIHDPKTGQTKSIRDHLLETYGKPFRDETDSGLVKKSFYNVSTNFMDDKDPVTIHLVARLKKQGYHGILDSNDLGSLSKSPVKIFDGSVFKVAGHEPLSESQITNAQNTITALMHMIEGIMKENTFDPSEIEEFLAHFGVKGMHWGQHRAQAQGRSDAVEFTKAKLAYGQGAGTRRKLIGAKVAQRSSNPHYKRAFEEHLANQDLAKRARQAKVGHNVKATGRSTAKTARGVHRSLTGGFGSVTLASAAIAGAIVLGRKTGTDKVILENANRYLRNHGSQAATKSWLRSQGVAVLYFLT